MRRGQFAEMSISRQKSVKERGQGKIARAASLLKRRYGDFAHYNRKNPFEELLFIICSVQTDEKKYRETFKALQRTFPRFTDLGKATATVIAKPLKPGGLSPTKSRMIRKICGALQKQFGSITLAPLRRMKDHECEQFLTSLPGVGLKVARCVMMYSLGRQAFPVDTHCWRICQRLGWIRKTSKDGVCTKRDMNRLQDKIPASLRFSLHVNFISFGREICTDRNPRCMVCPISDLCVKGKSLSKSRLE